MEILVIIGLVCVVGWFIHRKTAKTSQSNSQVGGGGTGGGGGGGGPRDDEDQTRLI